VAIFGLRDEKSTEKICINLRMLSPVKRRFHHKGLEKLHPSGALSGVEGLYDQRFNISNMTKI
jgi:hypothetical protein